MAVNEIPGSSSILFSALGSQDGTSLRRASILRQGADTQPTTGVPARTGNAFQQNVRQINIPTQNIRLTPLTTTAAPLTATAVQPTTAATATVPAGPTTSVSLPPPSPIIVTPATVQFALPVQNINVQPLAPAGPPTPTAQVQPPSVPAVGPLPEIVQPEVPTATAIVPTPTLAELPASALPTIVQPAPLQVTVPSQNVEAAATVIPITAEEPATAAVEAAAAPEAVRKNAQLINEALRNLGFTATAPTEQPQLLFTTPSPLITALLETQELTTAQQNALLVNQVLQNLVFAPPETRNPLLINELPARLEAVGITEDLTVAGRSELLTTETLLDVGLETTVGEAGQPPAAAVQEIPAAEEVLAETQTVIVAQAAPAGPPVTGLAAAAATTAAVTATAVTPAAVISEVAIPVEAAFLRVGFTPDTFPLTLFPDRTPYPLIVFQPNDPAPLPRPPAPIDRQVPPTTPVARTRMVGDARLRQLLRQGAGGGLRNVEYYTPQATVGQAEKSIRYSIGQVNAEMTSQGSSLHLVFAKHEDGFALDVYDCSYNEACRLAYDIPIPLDNLPGVLGSLEHETGIIVDRTS